MLVSCSFAFILFARQKRLEQECFLLLTALAAFIIE
jgi:hypothetical protein